MDIIKSMKEIIAKPATKLFATVENIIKSMKEIIANNKEIELLPDTSTIFEDTINIIEYAITLQSVSNRLRNDKDIFEAAEEKRCKEQEAELRKIVNSLIDTYEKKWGKKKAAKLRERVNNLETQIYNQEKNTDNFNDLKEFIKNNGYLPINGYLSRNRVYIYEAKRTDMSIAELLKEILLGLWAHSVQQHAKSFSITPEQQAEFNEIWNKTPTYRQKNNSDMLPLFEEFCKMYGYRPRFFISKEEAMETGMSEIELLKEIKLGQWIQSLHVHTENYSINWQYYEQHEKFVAIWNETPTYNKKWLTDADEAFRKKVKDLLDQYEDKLDPEMAAELRDLSNSPRRI